MNNENKTAVIIAAAGSGKRMGSGIPKQYLKIEGKPILLKTILAFCENAQIDDIFIVTNEEYIDYCQRMKAEYGLHKVVSVVKGGDERQDSVYAALQEVERCRPETKYVLIHDGARPFVDAEIIGAVMDAMKACGAATASVPVKDSIRRQYGNGSKNLKRAGLYAVQTPQGFEKKVLLDAYKTAYAEAYFGTDDASLVERCGQQVRLVTGKYENIKITTKGDMPMESRVGTGYDVHKLVEGEELVLGGLKIPFEKGLLGHSDADVLIHALMDALLGAAGLGDIGTHFPDTDREYKGISSIRLLERVRGLIEDAYYQIGNVDITLMAERPKIKPLIDDMKKNIAAALGIDESRINIKGTTTEKLGFVGREEGIAAQAVCMIYR